MPELPEVETIARGLEKRVRGDTITSVWLGSKPEPLKSSPAEIISSLQNTRIEAVRRVGKHIVFDLAPAGVRSRKITRSRPRRPRSRRRAVQAQWIVHLGMTGRVVVCDPGQPVEKHTHAILSLASVRELRFVDPRRFGRLSVAHEFAAPGSEPLTVGVEEFVPLFRGRKTPIKSALLNQKLLSGVGNIYADESLFRAGIRPRRRAASLTREQLRKLYSSIREVLHEAIALGGSTISDYVDANGEEGFFQLEHRVYGREGKPCLVCHNAVKRVIIAGRSSHYCPHCQR